MWTFGPPVNLPSDSPVQVGEAMFRILDHLSSSDLEKIQSIVPGACMFKAEFNTIYADIC